MNSYNRNYNEQKNYGFIKNDFTFKSPRIKLIISYKHLLYKSIESMLCTSGEQQLCRTFTIILMCNCLLKKNKNLFSYVWTFVNFETKIGIKHCMGFKLKKRERKCSSVFSFSKRFHSQEMCGFSLTLDYIIGMMRFGMVSLCL